MNDFLFQLLNSPFFWWALVIWVIVCLAWAKRWALVLGRISYIVPRPLIHSIDLNFEPERLPLYPRTLLEQIASGFKDFLTQPVAKFLEGFSGWIRGQVSLVWDKNHRWRTLGYLVFFIAFALLVLADAIAIAGTLELVGLWRGTMPDLLQRFDIAAFAGSLLALIMGFVIYIEIRDEESEFSNWSEKSTGAKNLASGIALLVVIFSMLTLIDFVLIRLVARGNIQSTEAIDFILNAILFGLVPINTAIAAVLCFSDAVRGFQVLLIGVQGVLWGVLFLFDWFLTALGSLLPILLDFIWRILHISIDIFFWFLTTPIALFLLPFEGIGKMLRGGPEKAESEGQ